MAQYYSDPQRQYVDALLSANCGEWPDLEGLIRDIYVSYLKSGDIALDVGVNHGTHLFQIAEAVGPEGLVVGVEAVPSHVNAVEQSMRLHYRHVADRIKIHSCAVSNEPGRAAFFVSKLNDGGLSGLHLRDCLTDSPVEKIEVDVRTIDDLIKPLGAVRFVKIDIEGAEFDALRGASNLLSQRPTIIFEFDETAPKSFGYHPDDFIKLFEYYGLAVHDIFGFPMSNGSALLNARVWNFVASPRELDGLALTAPARRTLETQFPALSAFATG